MKGRFRPRITLGGLLILVALLALVISALRPKTTQVVDLKVGTGPAVKAGDVVSVHYVGRLTDGRTFDASRPGGVPFDFVLGRGMVVRGWELGILGMRAGGVRRLTIPPEEAYGRQGAPPQIPPDATLVFEVELLGIQ